MGVRTEIQAKLIALFKVDTFELVQYDTNGIPSVGHGTETPEVLCNEISANLVAGTGQSTTYTLDKWNFDLICNFQHEVDYSNFIFGLENMSFVNVDETKQVQITVGNNILITHPVTQGGHTGTQLRFNVNAKIKV